MGVNKIVYGGQTKLDISNDTVTPSALLEGYTAHDNTGALIVGTASGGGEGGNVWQDANGYLHLDDESGIDLQTKSVTPTETAQSVTPDAGYYALEKVNVGAISNTYVGSGITQRSSSDLTASGATVTAPAGYYSSSASKSVSSMTLPTSTSSSATSGYTSKATISRSTSDQYINIPTGYNSSGAYYKVSAVANGTEGTPTATKGTVSNHAISITPSVTNTAGYISGGTKTGTAVSVSASELVSGTLSVTSSGTKDVTNYASASIPSGTATAPSSISGTSATVSTGTNTLTLSKTVSVTPNVSTAGYISSGTAGNSSVSLTASVNTRSSSDLTASTLTVTAPSGYYANNATKTLSDANLIAGNIKKNVSIFGVTGTYEGSGGGSGDLKALIERSTTAPTLPSDLTSVGDYAFYAYTDLALTSLPSGITSIGDHAFQSCSELALTSLPIGLTTIGEYAFGYDTSLALTSLPNGITNIPSGAFIGCSSMPLASLPSGLTSIGTSAFAGCRAMSITTIPSTVTSISSAAFQACPGLINIQSEADCSIATTAFNCNSTYPSNLESIRFPNFSKNTSRNWTYCCGSTTASQATQKLELADIGYANSILANAFANCYKLRTLILRKTSAVCSLANVSGLLNTPMRGYNSLTGTVYVPNSLISSYQTASNWSTLYNNGTVTFAKIEGSIYEL